MPKRQPAGKTPLDRLRSRYDDIDLTCPECGYEDDDGNWNATTVGRRIDYEHVCPSCGAVDHRTIHLDR